MNIKSYCRITHGQVLLNGGLYHGYPHNEFIIHDFLSSLYTRIGADYRKFYKMDALSKLGFLSSELLLAGLDRETPKEDMGIILFNSSASLDADVKYQKTIQNKEDFFPSPSDFVYTLPNIVVGEIAIRNKIHGETVFYVLPEFQGDRICEIIRDTLTFSGMNRLLAGWTEVGAFDNTLSSMMFVCQKEEKNALLQLTPENINKLYTNQIKT
ncbi:MAG: hypothetical protein LBN11_04030 [Tannerella sp.]|jgi:hypothetical protein|nr:hypothetical protein [Tannerella sp.]